MAKKTKPLVEHKPQEPKLTKDQLNGEEMAPSRKRVRYVLHGESGFKEAPPGRGQFGVYDTTTNQFAAILPSREEALAWAKAENQKLGG